MQGQAFEITGDIHSISRELHSSTLQYLGIEAAMRGFCREFGQQRKVQIDFAGKGVVTPLSPEISLCLYRVLQEALSNSTKHSGVQHFKVELFEESEGIHLVVIDSGIGFDPKSAMQSRGLGLMSMQERLKLVNGKFWINSQPGMGATIHAWVPRSK